MMIGRAGTCWVLGALLCLRAAAEIEIPKKCFEYRDLDKAMKVADEKGKLLIVIRVNLRTVRSSEEDAFEQYYKGFRSYGEIVVMDKRKDVGNLPVGLRDGFMNLEGGYPRAVAIDPDKPDEFVEMIPYLPISDREKRMKLYKNRIAK